MAESCNPKQEICVDKISVTTLVNVRHKGITRIQECIAHITFLSNVSYTFIEVNHNKQELINIES